MERTQGVRDTAVRRKTVGPPYAGHAKLGSNRAHLVDCVRCDCVACGGGTGTGIAPTPSPNPLAIGDPCLFGRWTLTSFQEPASVSFRDVTMSGTGGEGTVLI